MLGQPEHLVPAKPRGPRNGRPVVRPPVGWLAALAVLAGCSAGPPPPASSPVVLSGAPADTSPDQDRGAGSDLDDGEAIVRLAQEAATTITDDQADLDVEDQSGTGQRVAIRSALLSDGVGFVAIYDADLRLLGSTPVGSGSAPVSTALQVYRLPAPRPASVAPWSWPHSWRPRCARLRRLRA